MMRLRVSSGAPLHSGALTGAWKILFVMAGLSEEVEEELDEVDEDQQAQSDSEGSEKVQKIDNKVAHLEVREKIVDFVL